MTGIDNLHSGSGIDSMNKADITTIEWLDGEVRFKPSPIRFDWWDWEPPGVNPCCEIPSGEPPQALPVPEDVPWTPPPVNYNLDQRATTHYEERMYELALTLFLMAIVAGVYLLAGAF